MGINFENEWQLTENQFDETCLGKCESVMSLGNGYLGLRSSTEERYVGEKRGLFVAGTYNRSDKYVPPELPNAADFLEMGILLNGAGFFLTQGKILAYSRKLNFETGELHRHVEWVSPKDERYLLDFYRVVSLHNLHTIAQRVCIRPLSAKTEIQISTGINGQITNSGSQHFSEGTKRFYDMRYMQLVQTTTQSDIDFVFTADVSLSEKADMQINMDRRKLYSTYTLETDKGKCLEIQKITTVHTSRDKTADGIETSDIQILGLNNLKEQSALGYQEILRQSAKSWQKMVWNNIPVTIESDNLKDQVAIRFAQYHLQIMAPAHDNRMNIAAKGLSGEGYMGHVFWDTEIFVLPYYIFSQPATARSLEKHRYLSLPGARAKAKGNGYKGAQFPWESAWLNDGEVTPDFGGADVVTGLPIPVLTGKIEIHITCDVCYGVWQYYTVTGDEDFMKRYGYEIIFDAAIFWASRLEEGADGLLHINNVIGPDEYKDGVDDDAFTNYFARWNLNLAVEYYDRLTNTPLIAELEKRLHLSEYYNVWKEKANRMYIPKPLDNGVIAQNSTFLGLKEIDLSKYKNQVQVGGIYKDFNHDQICDMQVCKQADVLLLILLMEESFTPEVKRANWDYYEPRTLHDSSLSLSTHSILANDMGDYGLAYALFERACNIDMGPNMHSSDEGIHAGSIGGIWQCAVLGFGGLRIVGDKIRLNPKLPQNWQRLEFFAWIQNQKLKFNISKDSVKIENLTGTKALALEVEGKIHQIKDLLKYSK